MVRKVVIEILLVPESLNKKSDEIKTEILKDFNNGSMVVPWGRTIRKIRVDDK